MSVVSERIRLKWMEFGAMHIFVIYYDILYTKYLFVKYYPVSVAGVPSLKTAYPI